MYHGRLFPKADTQLMGAVVRLCSLPSQAFYFLELIRTVSPRVVVWLLPLIIVLEVAYRTQFDPSSPSVVLAANAFPRHGGCASFQALPSTPPSHLTIVIRPAPPRFELRSCLPSNTAPTRAVESLIVSRSAGRSNFFPGDVNEPFHCTHLVVKRYLLY